MDYGFSTTFAKTNSSFGKVSLADSGTETDVDGVKYVTKTLTIKDGYKPLASTLVIYYRLDFYNNNAEGITFAVGTKYKLSIANPKINMDNGTVIVPKNEALNQAVTYTLSSGGTDTTVMVPLNRPETYNHTIDMGEDDYLSVLGSVYIKNNSAGNESPYEKTYEAKFNTDSTAAKITLITVPIGSFTTVNTAPEGEPANGLKVTVTGEGGTGTVTLSEEQLLAAAEKPGNLKNSTYLMIYARDIGLTKITGVKAEIGKIPAGYTSCASTTSWTFLYNKAGAYGSFTNTGNGNQVNNTYHLYNTDPSVRDKTNGDLTVKSFATSTNESVMAMSSGNPYLTGIGEDGKITVKKAVIASDSSIPAGDMAVINGTLFPNASRTGYDKSVSPTVYAGSMYMEDPIIYLSLPAGLGLNTDEMAFSLAKYNDRAKLTGTEPITGWTADQISADGQTTVYKITMPDGTVFGYYDKDGSYSFLNYTLAFTTNKSLPTQRYRLNDIVTLVAKNQTKAVPYIGLNQGTMVYVKDDTNNRNGGKDVWGIVKDKDESPMGFGIQQQAEIVVNSAIAVSKINGVQVTPEWASYSPSNPNSIVMLGQNSEGQVRLNINNTSDNPGKNFVLLLPIPKKDADMGNIFMDNPQGVTLTMTNTPAADSASGFTVKYAKIDAAHDTLSGFFGGSNYTVTGDQSEANALLITASGLNRGEYTLYFDYTVSNAAAGALDIFRPVYAYTVQSDDRQKTGGYVASAVAGSKIDGIVFHDHDRNGVKDGTDSGVSGIQVVAKDAQGRTETATTDEDGKYSFTAVRETSVTLTFTVQGSESLRFNVQPPTAASGTVSTVLPSSDGKSAVRSLYASGDTKVNAAMSGFVKVSYDKNTATDGSLPADGEYTAGSTATVSVKPDNLVKTGYRFVEWNTLANGEGTGYQPGETFIITADTTLYAIWEIDSYLVTFNYRGATGGNSEASRQIEHNTWYGGTIAGGVYNNPLPTPTKTGNTFVGWTRIVTGTTANVFDRTRFNVGVDTILYAIWTPKTNYTVHYNTGGGSAIADQSVAWNGKVLPGAAPVKTGYSFDGWSCGDADITAYTTFDELAASDADSAAVTLTAKWRAKGGFTVKYNVNGGTGQLYDKTGVRWTDTSLLPANNPTRASYAFDGWTLDSTAQPVTAADSYGALAKQDTVQSVTLKAAWTQVSDNIVKYNSAGGTPVKDKNGVKSGDAGLIPADAPERAGYLFGGWTHGGKPVTAATVYSTLTTEKLLTLTAAWTEKSYTISYAPGNGESISDKTNVKWQDNELLPAAPPTKTGHSFEGWYYGTSEVSGGDTPETLLEADNTSTITLTAKWSEQSYTILYNSNGGSYFTPKTGVKYSAKNLLPDTAPAKTGYVFGGWFVEETSVTNDTPCSTVADKAEGGYITLAAKWTPKTGYTVAYNTGGGSQVASKTNVGWEDSSLLPATPPTRAGYTLIGWQAGRTVVSGTTPFSQLAPSDTSGTVVTLVAQWQEKTGYTVIYDTAGGGNIADRENVGWTQRQLLPSVNPAMVGFAFRGWKLENGRTVENSASYSSLAANANQRSVILIAQWEEKDYYIVEYDTDGGGSIADKNGVKWTDSGLVGAEVPVKHGYALTGWTYLKKSGQKAAVSSTTTYGALAEKDTTPRITLTAGWEAKHYKIVYDTAGGSPIAAGENLGWGDNALPIETTTRGGYDFAGWYLDTRAVTETDTIADLIPNDDKTEILLTAAWTKRAYTIRYNSDGGGAIADKTDIAFDAVGLLPDKAPAKRGYLLQGWYYGNTKVTGESTCQSLLGAAASTVNTLTLKAVWVENDSFTIRYDTSGGTDVADKTGVRWSQSGLLPTPAPEKPGALLLGWKCGAATVESSTAFSALAESDRLGTTVTLTAQWEKQPQKPVFTTQPADKTLTYGYTAGNTLSAAATAGEGDIVSYQWYSNTTDSSTGGTAISGAAGDSYTVPQSQAVGSYYYYCVVTAAQSGKSETAASDAATVTVEKAILTASFAGESIIFGDTPALAIAVTGFVNGETADSAAGYTAPKIGTPIPTAVGSHTLTPSGGAAANYSFTYRMGTLVISAGSMTSGVAANGYIGVYDGAAHGITVTLSDKAAGGAVTYGETAADCTQSTLTYTDAGSCKVYYKVSKAGYTDVTGNAIVTISKKPVSIATASVDDRIYNGTVSATGGNITLKDVVIGETVTAGGSITFADKNAGVNKAVDIADITLGGAGAKNYTIATDVSDVTTTAKITPKPVPLNWQNTDSKTYDGQPANVTATVASGLVVGDVCAVTVTDGGKTNAGTHTAAAALGNPNYSIDGDGTKAYTISKAKLTAAYEGESIIYKDAAPTLAVKVTGFVNGESAGNVGAGNSYTAPTVTFPIVDADHVGEHTLTPGGGSAANYDFTYVSGVLKILARDFNMVSIKDYLGDYDGGEHTITIIDSDPNASSLAVTYYTDNTYTTETTDKVYTHRTDAGTTTVYYTVSASGFNEAQGTATITINKKKVTPSVGTVSGKEYNGKTDAAGTIKLTGVAAADTANVTADGTMQFTDKNAGKNKSVTVTEIALSGGKAGNYELTAGTLNAATTAEITPKEITLTWSGHTGLAYTGKAQNVTAAIPAGMVVTGDTVTLTVTGGKKTVAGTNYTATAAIDNSNYSLANATQSYDIGKAALTAKYADESIVYGNLPSLAVTVTGFVNGESALTAAGYTAPTISTSPIPTAVGTHTIALTGGAATNYSFTLQDGTLTITGADMSGEVTSSGYNAAYDGAAHGITVNIPVGAAVKYYSDAACSKDETETSPALTNVADSPKTVYYKVTRQNYAGVKGSETITISPKTLTPALSAADSKTYDGGTDTTGGALTLTGVIGNEAVTASGTITFADKNVGKNKAVNVSGITLGGTAMGNYALSVTTLENAATNAEIRQKEVTLTWSGYENLVYDGIAKNVTAAAGGLIAGENCTVTVGGGKETLPGSYTAKATALSDHNYKLPSIAAKSYTIAPATFAITATPYQKLFDERAHGGVVTLTGTLPTDTVTYSTDSGTTWTAEVPQVGVVGETTIQIRVERRYHTTIKQTVTAKVWQAPIIKLDKPVFDSTDIKKATLGGSVTQGSFPIATQAFEYRKQGESNWTALGAGTTVDTVTTYRQEETSLAANTDYELRLSATDNRGNEASKTVLFRTQPTSPPTGAIEGSVGGGTGTITVTLEMGNIVVATLTGLNNNDTFHFGNLPDGEYNLVATDGVYTVTKMATVTGGGTTTLGLITIGSKQSVVKVEAGAPPVAANGLNEMFDTSIFTGNADATGAVAGGGTVEMRLTADKAKKQTEVDAIKQAATDKKTVGMMVDLTVDMITTPLNGLSTVENISDTETLMEIAVPLPNEAQGKKNYQMFRYHNGNVDELTLLGANDVPNTEGFRISGTYAYIYAQKFSTYAIAYDKSGGGENPGGGGENPGGGGGTGGGETSYYTITPGSSAGGQISPDKPVTVRGGNSAAFSMTPGEGYEIKDVRVDGRSVGAGSEYLFTNVWSDHTISVSFKKAAVIPPLKPKPDPTPGTVPGTTPGTVPGTTPGTVPGTTPGETDPDSKPDGKPDSKPEVADDSLDKQKEDIRDDLITKRDEAIASLPDTLTDEQRQDAIDELNKICDDAIKALDSAKSAAEVSDILNNAIQAFHDTVEELGGEIQVSKPADAGGKPFILLSALLALAAVLLAVLTVLKKCTKKRKLMATLGAAAAVVIFLVTTGWSGFAFANLWTIAVALTTALPAFTVIMKLKEEKEQEENPQ